MSCKPSLKKYQSLNVYMGEIFQDSEHEFRILRLTFHIEGQPKRSE